jgi:hypothetical protein
MKISMIKYLKYMFVAAITMIAATGCQEDWEDTFSKAPTAPELVNNGTILMTQNTMSESITWAWTAARFMQGEVTYSLFAQYGEGNAVQVGTSTKALTLSLPKTEFHALLNNISGIPQNASFDLAFYVEAADAEGKYPSAKQTVKIFAYGDAVSPVVTLANSELVLDVTTPAATIDLLTWEPARLNYNKAITYSVYAQYEENEAVEAAKDLTETAFSLTVDELNELAVSAGAPEAAEANVKFIVKAFSESYPEGVPSDAATMKITTYVASYPECMYLPGSYQGWDPATAVTIKQSTTTKGLYAAYVDLTTADGSDVEFKFSPVPAWEGDFGSDDFTVSTEKGFAIGTGSSVGGTNIKVPSGLYHIALNKKFNKIEMVQINQMGMIGGFNGWGSDLVMEYDAATNTYSAIGTFEQGVEYKFRANADWTYAIGADGLLATSADNCVFEKETGEYKVVLDVNQHPYSVKILSTSFPEQLYMPGNHQGWAPDAANCPTLQGNGEGIFEGAVNLVAADGSNECQFKFSPVAAWSGDFGATITFDESGMNATGAYGVPDNIVVPNGYYYITVDMTAGTLTLNRIDKVGLIGGFNGWGGDIEFTFDSSKNVWTLTQEIKAADEFKVRFNGGWDLNRGIGGEGAGVVATGIKTAVYHNGQNMKVAEDGTYTITLDMSTNPNTITITK